MPLAETRGVASGTFALRSYNIQVRKSKGGGSLNVLVINAGSSSLKYQLLNVETHALLAKGICERVGSPDAFHKHGIDDN